MTADGAGGQGHRGSAKTAASIDRIVPTAVRRELTGFRYRYDVADEGGRVRASRSAAVTLVWVAATLVGLVVAATTKIGPVLLTISARHGIHLGDLLAFAVSYATALVITAVVLNRL
jgi:hypothetical protein